MFCTNLTFYQRSLKHFNFDISRDTFFVILSQPISDQCSHFIPPENNNFGPWTLHEKNIKDCNVLLSGYTYFGRFSLQGFTRGMIHLVRSENLPKKISYLLVRTLEHWPKIS